jgi:hypothetical protein
MSIQTSAGSSKPLMRNEPTRSNVACSGCGNSRTAAPEQRRRLDRQRGGERKRERDDGVGAKRRLRLAAVGVEGDKLFPQPLGMFARKLARQRIEFAHALDRHEERLVRRETRFRQRVDLRAQMILELRHVDRVDGLTALEIAAPPADLLLERG